MCYPHPPKKKRKTFQVSCTVPGFLLYHIPSTPREFPLGNCFNFDPTYIYLSFLFQFKSLFSKQICQLYALTVLWFASRSMGSRLLLDETQQDDVHQDHTWNLPWASFLMGFHGNTAELVQNTLPRTRMPWRQGFSTSSYTVHICSESDALLVDVSRTEECCQGTHL